MPLLKDLVDRQCPVFSAPTDGVLHDLNIVQSDVFIVCDTKNITDNNIQVSPDLIIEIIKENMQKGIVKKNRYSGSEIFNWDEIFKLTVFDIEIKLWEIFEKEKAEDVQTR